MQQVPGGLAQDGEVGALVQTLLQLVALAVKQLAVGDGAGPRGDVLDLQRAAHRRRRAVIVALEARILLPLLEPPACVD